MCTGKEDRILECGFPEDFDSYNNYDYYYGLPSTAPPPPDEGIGRARCRRIDNNRLSVVCRQFEITGARLYSLWMPQMPDEIFMQIRFMRS